LKSRAALAGDVALASLAALAIGAKLPVIHFYPSVYCA
jgi:hypothetical protein